ncbi:MULTISPECIES: hypothetical protein [unclassified Mesorhizobium]|uniref:hypothetical protein n=1 Tax=unclassified Mesorhizobium TaxID=325217 RepID=UPI0033366942
MAARRSWAKAYSPYRSSHVASWYHGNQDALEYCRRRDLSITTFELWMRHLVGADDLCKRAEKLQNLRRKKAARSRNKAPPKRPKRPPRYRYSRRTDSSPIALQAFWGMHVEAMNWSGMGMRICRGTRPLAACVADLAQSPGRIRRRNGLAIPASSECPSPIKQRCQLRATQMPLHAGRGGWAIEPPPLQRLAEAGDHAGGGEARHRSGAGLPSWRRHQHGVRRPVEFSLTARTAPQLATVALIHGAENEPPAPAILRKIPCGHRAA